MAVREWHVLEKSLAGSTPWSWTELLSLSGWSDPVARATVLRDLREHAPVGEQFRMVRHTEEVLDE